MTNNFKLISIGWREILYVAAAFYGVCVIGVLAILGGLPTEPVLMGVFACIMVAGYFASKIATNKDEHARLVKQVVDAREATLLSTHAYAKFSSEITHKAHGFRLGAGVDGIAREIVRDVQRYEAAIEHAHA